MATAWERLGRDTGGTVAGLAATGRSWVFAATPVGVYRSTDGGRSWTLPGVNSSVPFAEVVLPSPHFEQDRTLFVCGGDALYRSTDGGDTWQPVLAGSRMLSVVASSGEVVLAGSESDGILRSEDSGRSWVGANAGMLDLTAICLALSPCFDRDRTGFAGTPSGLHRTRNAGRSWRALEVGFDDVAVQCLAVSPDFASNQLVLAGTEADGLLRSTDGGTSWHRPTSLASGGVAALAFSAGREIVAAATEAGVAISRDAGETWSVPSPVEPVLSVLFAGQSLLAGVHRGGVRRSEDGGATWQRSDAGLSARLDTELVLSPDFAHDRTVFVGGVEDGLRVSSDGGDTWDQRLSGAATAGVSLSADGIVYIAVSDGFLVSRDGARTWQAAIEAPARGVATGPGVALAALEGGRLTASHDAGRSWHDLATPWNGLPVVALAVSPAFAQDRAMFAATADVTESVLWRSVDGGERWQRWLVLPGARVGRLPVVVAPTYPIDGTLLVGHGGQVWRPLRHVEEVRGGERRPTFRGAALGASTPLAITALAVSPMFAQDRTVFAASNVGTYISRNGGESFVVWNEGLDQPRMVSIAASPNYTSDRLVYALGLGGTLWRRRDVRS